MIDSVGQDPALLFRTWMSVCRLPRDGQKLTIQAEHDRRHVIQSPQQASETPGKSDDWPNCRIERGGFDLESASDSVVEPSAENRRLDSVISLPDDVLDVLATVLAHEGIASVEGLSVFRQRRKRSIVFIVLVLIGRAGRI